MYEVLLRGGKTDGGLRGMLGSYMYIAEGDARQLLV